MLLAVDGFDLFTTFLFGVCFVRAKLINRENSVYIVLEALLKSVYLGKRRMG